MRYLLSYLTVLALLTPTWSSPRIELPVTYDTLKNGLRIIIVPDTNVAVVSCRLYYLVGSMNEGPGTTGLSHMYEHMMFKGTRRLGTTNFEREIPLMKSMDSLENLVQRRRGRGIAEDDSQIVSWRQTIGQLLEKQRLYMRKDEIWELYMNNGGTNLNAWTSDDMTAYIVTLPKNKLELFYWIEADRMKDPILREFHSEREVVTEERRMRYENVPLNRYYEQLMALFYLAHPYRLPTIGWMSDIRSYTRELLQYHVNRFYTPDNAIIVLVGNVNPQSARSDIERYFGQIPRYSGPRREVVTREPEPLGEKRFTVYDKAKPRIDILFPTPGYPHPDLYQLDMVQGILSGRSGRLYRRLVLKEGLCTDVTASNAFRLHNGYFAVSAELRGDADPLKVEAIIREELKKLSSHPPTPAEMQRNKNTIRMEFVSGLSSLEGLSDRLAWFERLGGWKDLLDYPGKIAEVNPESIPAVVKTYLTPQRATVGLLLEKKENAR